MLKLKVSPEVMEQLCLIVASKATPDSNIEQLTQEVLNTYTCSFETLMKICSKNGNIYDYRNASMDYF